MFSGIVEAIGSVRSVRIRPGISEITLGSEIFHKNAPLTAVGSSVCVNGACLTVTSIRDSEADFSLAEETLRRTVLGQLKVGSRVNLERSLRLGDGLHGHMVLGHVDGQARVISREDEGDSVHLVLQAPEGLNRYIAEKGSVCLDGVSLTVGKVHPDTFSVYLIPHTLGVTTLSSLNKNDIVNLEVDCIARYVERLLQSQGVEP